MRGPSLPPPSPSHRTYSLHQKKRTMQRPERGCGLPPVPVGAAKWWPGWPHPLLLVSLIALLPLVPTPGAAQGAPNATPTVTPPLFYGDFSFSFNPAVIPSCTTNALPLSSRAAPRVLAAAFLPAGVTHADTRGGTALVVTGANLGHLVDRVGVEVTVRAGVLAASNCSFLVPHTSLTCLLPSGAGAISLVTVRVLASRRH